MADQKRWFKLWCSAPSDDDLLALSPDLRWAWAVLGCYTKEHGTRGRVKVSASAAAMTHRCVCCGREEVRKGTCPYCTRCRRRIGRCR